MGAGVLVITWLVVWLGGGFTLAAGGGASAGAARVCRCGAGHYGRWVGHALLRDTNRRAIALVAIVQAVAVFGANAVFGWRASALSGLAGVCCAAWIAVVTDRGVELVAAAAVGVTRVIGAQLGVITNQRLALAEA